MTLKHRRLVVFAGLLVLSLLAGFWLLYSDRSAISPEPSQKEGASAAAANIALPQDLPEAITLEYLQSVGASKKLINMVALAQALQYPIDVYVQLVDQNDQPLSGAEVAVSISGSGWMAPGEGDGVYLSDGDGLINIRGKGRLIEIESVTHPEIARFGFFEPGAKFATSLYLSSSGQNAQGKWTDHTAPDKPYKVQLWRAPFFESVVSKALDLRIPVNDGRYYISLLDPRPENRHQRWGISREKSENSLLGFHCRRVDNPAEPMTRFDVASWQLEVVSPGGQVLEQSEADRYNNLAPADGYSDQMTIQSKSNAHTQSFDYGIYSSDYSRGYFTQPGRNLYGAFSLSVNTFSDNGKFCQLSGRVKYQQSGSRNLALRAY